MASVVTKGTVVSFGNTPQAVDDNFTNSGVTENGGSVILDVMGNDLGGAAKSLYSLDDGTSAGGIRPTDLLARDAVGSIQYSAMGAEISITADGKVAYNLTSAVSASLQHLGEGDSVTDTFTYAIKLGNGTLAWATATVTIAGSNDGPVAVADVNSTFEDSVITGSVAGNDSDIDNGAVLTYSLDGPVAGLTINPDGSYSFDAGDAAYQSLAQGATANVVANYTVTDEWGATSTSTLTITVTGTNDGPVAVADTGAGDEDSVIIGSVVGNDSDVDDGAVLTYSLDAPVAGLTLNANGSYSFDASQAAFQSLAAGATVDVAANYTVTDEFGATSTSTLTITVTGTNDAPVAVADTNSGSEDSVILGSVATNDGDVDDGAVLTYSLDADVAGLVLNADGSYSFDAGDAAYQSLNDGDSLPVVASYTVTDQFGATSSSTLTITVDGVTDIVAPPPPPPLTLPSTYTGTGDPNDFDSGNDGNTAVWTGDSSGDSYYGGNGSDVIRGNGGDDTLYGGSGNDDINGNGDNDTIYGGSGNDTLQGSNGADTIIGGYGADAIIPGNGGDMIRYLSVLDTNDTITGFVSGSDKIDVSPIDANTNVGGDQAFGWGGNVAGVVANSLTWTTNGTDVVVLGDTDGVTTTAEFMVTLTGITSIAQTDFQNL